MTEFLKTHAREGEWTDDDGIMVAATVSFIERNVIVVEAGRQGGKTDKGFFKMEGPPIADLFPPVIVGLSEEHYQSLRVMNQTRRKRISHVSSNLSFVEEKDVNENNIQYHSNNFLHKLKAEKELLGDVVELYLKDHRDFLFLSLLDEDDNSNFYVSSKDGNNDEACEELVVVDGQQNVLNDDSFVATTSQVSSSSPKWAREQDGYLGDVVEKLATQVSLGDNLNASRDYFLGFSGRTDNYEPNYGDILDHDLALSEPSNFSVEEAVGHAKRMEAWHEGPNEVHLEDQRNFNVNSLKSHVNSEVRNRSQTPVNVVFVGGKGDIDELKKYLASRNFVRKGADMSKKARVSGVTKRRRKCAGCLSCLAPNCNKCRYCKDMKKNGGPGRLKQKCIERRCFD